MHIVVIYITKLTVTELDTGHPHHNAPVDTKRGQVYTLRNHLEVVEARRTTRLTACSTGTTARRKRRGSTSMGGMRAMMTVAETGGHAGTTTTKAVATTATIATAACQLGQGALAARGVPRTASAPTDGAVGMGPHLEDADHPMVPTSQPKSGRSRSKRRRRPKGSPSRTPLQQS
jgi:hypothetical protein